MERTILQSPRNLEVSRRNSSRILDRTMNDGHASSMDLEPRYLNMSRFSEIEIPSCKRKTNLLYPQFLEVLQSRTHNAEIFDNIQDFIEICSCILEEVIKENRFLPEHEADNAVWLEQEKNTWKLLHCLYKDRIMIQKDSDYDMPFLSGSEKEIMTTLYSTNAVLREYQLVVDWLEACAQDEKIQVPHFTDRTIGWENTLYQLQCPESVKFGGTQDIVKHLDPDAPYREKKALHPLDFEDQERLVKHVFRLIRQGKIEDAKTICEYCGQPWRAAILEGWRLYEDPNYESANDTQKAPIEGNPRRDVWKKFAWMVADSNKSDEYTRAIAGVFCGHLESLLAVSSNSWDDLLWAYLKVQIDIRVESELRSCCSKSYTPMPENYEKNKMSLHQIFDEISIHKNIKIQEAAKNPVNVIQKYLIMDNISELLRQMQRWIEEQNLSPHMIRFLAHIVLFMRQIGRIDREEIANQVIKTYVNCLIEIGDAQLIAFYTSELPVHLQTVLYSKYLQTVTESAKRKTALEEALSAGLDVQSITNLTVESIRNRQDTAGGVYLRRDEISSLDEEKISALEWLTFYPEQEGELLWQANALIRVFLADGKIENVQKTVKMIPGDTINQLISTYGAKENLPYREECSIREYLCYQTYLAAIESFNDWTTLFYNRPKEPKVAKTSSNFTERIASEHKQQTYKAELERWKNHLNDQMRVTKDLLFNVLLFPEKGWLLDPDALKEVKDVDIVAWENRNYQMEGLRKLCIPEIVLLLHKVLHWSGDYKECIRLADEIASEQGELYKVYSKHKLAELLSKISESSLALINEQLDPWGYTATS